MSQTSLDYHQNQNSAGAVELSHDQSHSSDVSKTGSSIQTDEVKRSLETSFQSSSSQSGSTTQSQAQTDSSSNPLAEAVHLDPDQVSNARGLSAEGVKTETNLEQRLGATGDFLDPKGGNDTVIGGLGDDIIRGSGGGFKTITGGGGSDLFVLGKETTNRILGFDPSKDKFAISDGLNIEDIRFGQGTDPTKGGLNQPLNSENNTVVFDASGDESKKHILASLPFVNANQVNEQNFTIVDSKDLDALADQKA